MTQKAMAFVACGLNHKTAPIDVREKFSLSSTAYNTLLDQLGQLNTIHEIVLLSTCNRTEIYCETDIPETLLSQLTQHMHFSIDDIERHFYLYQDDAAVRHLLRVASGLDSMMLGEPQIFGQLKRAYQEAAVAGTIKNNLHGVFQFVFGAAKRVRTQSGIGNNPVSIAYAATQLIIQQFKTIDSLNIFIIGSGETATLVAKYLQQNGAQHFMIANRTQEHANILATRLNAKTLSITDIPQYLSQADVVISATTCPLPFINKHMVEKALFDRDNALMFLLDLAIPRDIEANVATLDSIHLYNIDDLHNIVGAGMEERRAAALQAEQLINIEIENFQNWQRTTKANQLINDYRSQMKELAAQELQRAQQKLATGQCQQSVIKELSERLVNKLTHLPTLGLRQAASDERVDFLNFIQYFLNKNPEQSTL